MKCGISKEWLRPFSDALALYFYITYRNWNPSLKNKNESAQGWKVSKDVASHLHTCDMFVLCCCQSSSPPFMLSWRSYGYSQPALFLTLFAFLSWSFSFPFHKS